jgi:hypothetical protein
MCMYLMVERHLLVNAQRFYIKQYAARYYIYSSRHSTFYVNAKRTSIFLTETMRNLIRDVLRHTFYKSLLETIPLIILKKTLNVTSILIHALVIID